MRKIFGRSKMLKCQVKAEIIKSGEAMGLSLILSNGERRVYGDVATDAEAIYAFADKINRGNVSEIHIEELIEDFIG